MEPDLNMVRLFPINFRYLDPEQKFKAFQYIEADIRKDESDPRPESYRVRHDSIEVKEFIPPGENERRVNLLLKSPHYCESVEELWEKNAKDGTSLGIVRPDKILDYSIEFRSEDERDQWLEKEAEILAQLQLLGPPLKKLDFPQGKYFVKWRCRNEACLTHNMSIHQWGIHELARKLEGQKDAKKKMLAKMKSELDDSKQEIYLFLGNFRAMLFGHNFGLMDSFSPNKERQRLLL
jgi:hypothetical protein